MAFRLRWLRLGVWRWKNTVNQAEVEMWRALKIGGEAMSHGLLEAFWTRGCESWGTMGSMRA